MTKILFVVPMHISLDAYLNPDESSRSYLKEDGRSYRYLATDLPLGPLSMSAYLKKHADVEVRLIDFNVEVNHLAGFTWSSFLEYVQSYFRDYDWVPDIVGVSSLFSPSYQNFVACGSAARQCWPSSFVIGGGNIPTNSYARLFQSGDGAAFDAFCYGEGEKPLLELIQTSDRWAYCFESDHWIVAENLNQKLFEPRHHFIDDLDDIPFFDYQLCDIERHDVHPIYKRFDDQLEQVQSAEHERGFHIMTSRGCPFLCTFCASHRTHGRKMRYHSLERVRQDLELLVQNFGATTVIFQDDHLMADPSRVKAILGLVKELGLKSLYQNGLTLYALDRPMLEAFVDAGVKHLVLPVESGSEKVLKQDMRKPLKMRISERVAADCRDLGIYTHTNLMIGMPGETPEDIEEARINLRRLKTNWFNIACAAPLVGSEMHEISLAKGYITDDTLGSDYHKAIIKTENFDPAYIQRMHYVLNLELNFVYNQDVAVGDFMTALRGFTHVLSVRQDHAFAHYFAGLCYARVGNADKAEVHRRAFEHFRHLDPWPEYVALYGLDSADIFVSTDGHSMGTSEAARPQLT